jgi:hypothetical protein
MKKAKKEKASANGASHTYAGRVLNVQVDGANGGATCVLSKKKGDSRRFAFSVPDQQAAMISLASSALAIGKKLHVEFVDSGQS